MIEQGIRKMSHLIVVLTNNLLSAHQVASQILFSQILIFSTNFATCFDLIKILKKCPINHLCILLKKPNYFLEKTITSKGQ